ncbi:MAG: hypothetical protein B6U95_07890, partial [Thermofilum sp. ex4484_82]
RAGYGILTVRENLWYYSQLYGYGWREGWKKVDELISLQGYHILYSRILSHNHSFSIRPTARRL